MTTKAPAAIADLRPASPYRAPLREDLGAFLGRHERQPLGELLVRDAKDLGLALFLGLTVALTFWLRGADDPVRGPAYRWFGVVLVGSVSCLVAVHLARWARLRRRRVDVFARGVAAEGPDGAFWARWTDLAGVRVEASLGAPEPSAVWLRRADGAHLLLTDEVAGIAALAERVAAETRPHLLAAALARLAAGETVSFGAAAVSPAGIALRHRRFVPWAEVERCAVADGALVVWTWRGDVARGCGALENAHVLSDVVAACAARGARR